MAGIGFELQRVLRKGGLGSFVKVALSGVVIVAGPWILSMIGIFLVGRYTGFALEENRSLFMGVIIYSYAFSLFIFGGIHYIFTRLISDLIYLGKSREAASTLALFSLAILILATGMGAVALSAVRVEMAHLRLFKAAALLFFASINIIWLLMIFISLLKRFMAIFIAFLLGMTCSVLGVGILGRRLALGGAMLGFSLGQLLIAAQLLFLSFKAYRPGNPAAALKELQGYFPRYIFLFLTGLFYYWGIWIDKMVFWLSVGGRVPGTFIRLFDPYDISVYFANLTMIPGLIYFVVVYETGFYLRLKEFLRSLIEEIYWSIQEKKRLLAEQMKAGLWEQSVFQALVTGVFFLLAPLISGGLFGGATSPETLRLTLLAVFFQLLFLTLMTFLFYFEMYIQSFMGALVFFTVNLAGSLLIVLFGKEALYGLSYLLAGLAASIVVGAFLFSASRSLERRIYALHT